MSENLAFAVIGGSGLYHMQGLENVREYHLETPFGKPSSPIIVGNLEGKPVAFLARHGIGHFISPSEVNYRANIYALKSLGARQIISISACGSLREDYAPGHIIIPDQLFDNTKNRSRTFFENGLVAHIGVADPFCNQLSSALYESVNACGAQVHKGGTFITIEGPRFSTKAESHVYRAWGMSLIGMTACPEAFLAREAEICYATMAHVTDYDVWHVSAEPVSVEMVIRTLNQNTAHAQEALRIFTRNLNPHETCACHQALNGALITHPEKVTPETSTKLSLLIEKYIQ
jgi:5'-methylthioadenosine phosphorylase